MRNQVDPTSQPVSTDILQNAGHAQTRRLPNRLMTVFEVAEFVGCHEESVRRAYLCGQLKRHRFGVRNWRFDPAEVQEWIDRGAPTRVS